MKEVRFDKNMTVDTQLEIDVALFGSAYFTVENGIKKRIDPLKIVIIKSKDKILKELVLSSWWASWISINWIQNIAAKYYARKAERKYNKQFLP